MRNKLKGYRKIDKFLTDWCHANNFDIKCRLGTDFEYDSDAQILYYAVAVAESHDKYFYEFCQKYLTNVEKCDNFILSFFHEIGHYCTEDKFDDTDWSNYYDFLDAEFHCKNSFSERDYFKYYSHPIEVEATKWACEFIDNNIDAVSKFWEGLAPLIMNFYEVNKVEI